MVVEVDRVENAEIETLNLLSLETTIPRDD